MRLHRMTMTAFGPYPGTCEVDFDELSAAGLFLLHGPTGAGKSSVLDAVSYALYGGVPGARQGMRLRSDHAAAHTPTEVALELTVGGRRLRITRRPEQPRPKKRGAGTTMDKALSLLAEQVPSSAEWKALSRSHQEIGEEITQLLGMNREQFCQVVLLPQGDFARFLRADAGERAVLLGRLFDTRRFAAVESWLAERRREAEVRARAQDERLIALAHAMRQAAGPALAQPLPTAEPGDPELAESLLAWAAVARSTAREQADIAELALTSAEGAHRQAQRALEEAAETARLQRRHAEALARSAALEAERAGYERVLDRLERARAAQVVAPVLALRDAALREYRTASGTERRARGLLPAELAEAAADRLAATERKLTEDIGRLSVARRAEQRAAELVAERDALDREAAADEDLDRDTEGWLEGWEALRAELRRRVEAAQDAASRAEQLAVRLETARRRLAAAHRRDELAATVGDAEARMLRAREEFAAAQERWLELKDRRLRGFAAELAAALRDGAPCTVCGSTVHPEPARPGAGHVDRDAEEAAHRAYRAAEQSREEAVGEVQTARERLSAAHAAAGDTATGRLAAEVAELESDWAAARDAAADGHPARQELDGAEREHARRLALLQQAQTRSAARISRREALSAELASLEAEVAGARAGADSVAEHTGRLQRRVRLLAEAAAAARATAAADQRLQEAEADLKDAAAGAGFPDPRSAADALLGDGERRGVQQRVDRFREQQAALAAALADRQAAAAAALPAADPEARRTELEAATRRLREAAAADSAARSRCFDLDRLSAQAARGSADLAPLRVERSRLRRLSLLASGTSTDNELRMRLESYVLAARLEQVAAAASVRLHRMSLGRYTLVHTDARSFGRGRSGLGLQVVDAWTGTERDTATLSGGETFSASLALALGLADVVSEEAGGVRLDTLFIDEGFGSLDEQTLDEVLDVLDGLRERDRAVGIVSHVADLRHRIPVQLEVVKGRGGSMLRHRTAAAL